MEAINKISMQESSEKKSNQYSIAFYNLENLFDTNNDPTILDDDFTQFSERKWNKKRFSKKIKKLGQVISQIGYNEISHPPVICGVAEVENSYVLDELIKSKYLKNKGYKYIHFDSPDERGIDTALLYREEYFTITDKKTIALHIVNELGIRDFTRDILHVRGILDHNPVHILVNHWPSRRAGVEETNYKRLAASFKNREIVTEILLNEPQAKIIIMGDFNDDPKSNSIRSLVANDFYNPMEILLTLEAGSLSYRGKWNLFDQIILSHNFLKPHSNPFQFIESKIFNPNNLREYKGRNKGIPFRTFAGRKYLGGYSDHFPVYSMFFIQN